jgi:hypothetical protein
MPEIIPLPNDGILKIYHHSPNDTFMYLNKDRVFHREPNSKGLSQPAAIWSTGAMDWFINGHLHRLDGCATYDPKSNFKRWAVKGKFYDNFSHIELLYLQISIKFLFFLFKNANIYRPNFLGGVITKKNILNIFN